jgi:hypothetical protein
VGIDEEHRGFGVVGVDGEVTRHDLVGHECKLQVNLPPFAAKRIKVAAVCGLADQIPERSGTPEGVPRTAAIKRVQT